MLITLLHGVTFAATFLLSLALGLYVTPIVRRGAVRFGVLDRPDGDLKRQREPVPYLGGIAVYLAFLITLAVVFEFEPTLLGLLLGGTMVAMLGLFDDMRVLPPRVKLAGQLLAAFVLLKSGISIQLVAVPALIALPLSVLWIVGVTNALNIVDVSDGLSSGVAAIAALALFIIAVTNGEVLIATTTLAMVGSLVGFLRYNQPPARIYLGDTGSLFIGFMLAALSMIGAYTSRSLVGALAPLLILYVPILDTTLVVIARVSRGISPMQGSPDHFAIRLRARGWSAAAVARFGYGLGLWGAVTGVLVTLVPAVIAAAIAGTVLASFVGVLVWTLRLPVPIPVALRASALVAELAPELMQEPSQEPLPEPSGQPSGPNTEGARVRSVSSR